MALAVGAFMVLFQGTSEFLKSAYLALRGRAL
jgi:hypothetical protein